MLESRRDSLLSEGAGARVAVLGAGSWGAALALLLARNGHSVSLWDRNPDLVAAIQSTHVNERYLRGFVLPDAIEPCLRMDTALHGADVVVLAVPCGALREVCRVARADIPDTSILVSAAKGLEETTSMRPSETICDVIPGSQSRLVALSGPNLAAEVARGLPTAAVAASANPEAARLVQRIFGARPEFRVYTGTDVTGVELGGAVKNMIAIAAGVCEGLALGDNSKAALMTRGLSEAIRLGVACGAETGTFLGLSGVGDLIATAASGYSRNHRVGVALGEGRSLESVLREIGQVAEGVPTTRVLYEMARRLSVEMPLCAALYAVLFQHRAAQEMIQELLMRPPREES